MSAHPEDHPGQDAHGREGQHTLDRLLRLALELAHQQIEKQPGGDTHNGGYSSTRPDCAQSVPATDLVEIRNDDREDENDLEALA